MSMMPMRSETNGGGQPAGFTLIEILVAMAVTAIFLTAVYATYWTQQRSASVQDQVVDMQQNIRAALVVMTQDIREAGCDPTMTAGAGFVTATAGRLELTRDIAGNASDPNTADGQLTSANEDIVFGFDPAVDASGGGTPTTTVADLCREDVNAAANTYVPIAQDIQRIQFNYLDADGNYITPGTSPSALKTIRAVQITLLARTAYPDPKFTNTAIYTYTNSNGNKATWGPFNDHYRRRLVVTVIQCRNMGLSI